MRCTIKGCNITCKHPQKSMCWKDFSMCKFHAFEFHPEIYESSGYRPMSDKFARIARKIEFG